MAGLARSLSHEDAARFSFLLATPVIFGAGVHVLFDLAGQLGGVRAQTIVGNPLAGIAVFASVRLLVRFFRTRTIRPFAVYRVIAGRASLIRFASATPRCLSPNRSRRRWTGRSESV